MGTEDLKWDQVSLDGLSKYYLQSMFGFEPPAKRKRSYLEFLKKTESFGRCPTLVKLLKYIDAQRK